MLTKTPRYILNILFSFHQIKCFVNMNNFKKNSLKTFLPIYPIFFRDEIWNTQKNSLSLSLSLYLSLSLEVCECTQRDTSRMNLTDFSCTQYWVFHSVRGARCSFVVRAFAHGAMGCRIDPLWWTHWAISRSSQCSTTGVTKAVVCVILSVGWCI